MRGEIEAIHAKGAELVVVGNGAPWMAKAFVDEIGLTTPVLTDPSLASYRLAGLKRGVMAMLSPRMALHAARAMRAGFRQTATRGDALQLGGVLVIEKGGRILYTHVDREPGDVADVRAVVAALP